MNVSNTIPVIDQIEAAIHELRTEAGLGPVSRKPGVDGLAAPLVAGNDPMHPTLFALLDAGRIWIGVDWVATMYSLQDMEGMLDGLRKRQAVDLILALASILCTNPTNGTSYVGLQHKTGNIFVRDSFPAVAAELLHVKRRLASLIEHARAVRKVVMFFWSHGLNLPDPPDSPLPNGF